jgi:predicted ATPase
VEVPIVGRGDELAQVRAALVAASAGSGWLALVSGEPGIGKTRLASAIADMAREYDIPVAAGYAADDPGMPPLWPWRRVGRTVPALADVLSGGAGATAAVDLAAARFGMFSQASQALADAAADRGCLSSWKTCSGPTGPRCCFSGTWPASSGRPGCWWP